jgi:hypothetical protein
MTFTQLVPNVFYADMKDALDLFVNCLEFKIEHNELKSDNPFCVIEKNGLRMNLFQNTELAKEHNPEFRLVTNNIDEVFKTISSSHPEFLHPNLNKITLRPWGAKDFALTVRSGERPDRVEQPFEKISQNCRKT